MVTTVLAVIPVLNRPHRVAPLLASLHQARNKILVEHLFVVSSSDRAEIQTLMREHARFLIVDWQPDRADYARKINTGILEAEGDWVFAGADDLAFQPGWADEAVNVGEKTGGRFVATNDLGNPMVKRGRHATHPVVHVSYLPLAVVDDPGKLYSEAYDHQCCDVEASETATRRGEFVFAPRSIVEHQHPVWRKNEMDATYVKGQRQLREDMALLRQRRKLWVRLKGQPAVGTAV